MQKLTSSEGLLIVVELGAEWPSAELESRTAKARRVFAQDETESPVAFAQRVTEQLSRSFPSGVAVGSVVVACSERIDAHAQGARTDLARAMAGLLGRAGGGGLSFVASDRNEERSKPVLSSLLGELNREWQSAGVEVKLSFGQSPLAVAAGESAEAGSSPRASARGSAPAAKNAARRVA